jgi:hypothetical protein
MDPNTNAVINRVTELTSNIKQAEEEILNLDANMSNIKENLQQQLNEMETAHTNAIVEKEKDFTEELHIDKELTRKFVKDAHASSIQTIMRHQDGVLEEEFIAVRENYLNAAEDSLEKMKENLLKRQKRELEKILHEEEDDFQKRVKRAIHIHEENMRRL